MMFKTLFRTRRNQYFILVLSFILILYCFALNSGPATINNLEDTRRISLLDVGRLLMLGLLIGVAAVIVVLFLKYTNDNTGFSLLDEEKTYYARPNEYKISLPDEEKTSYARPTNYYGFLRKMRKERRGLEKTIRESIESALQYDKGTGCEIPKLDPFSVESSQFDEVISPLVCNHLGLDWVRCHLSKCSIRDYIKHNYEYVECHYQDIIYVSDKNYYVAKPVKVYGGDTYYLEKSDHVKVTCTGKKNTHASPTSWKGHLVGYRRLVTKPPPPGREQTLNVLIFGFDSTSKNAYIRRMPKSYKVMTETMKAHIFEGFNVVGDGTPATLFPLMTGKTELELPDVRKSISSKPVDSFPWIWYKLRDDGYNTAYYEDMPNIGTFQYRFNGFSKQPADHYLRAFFLESWKDSPRKASKYCIGDTPSFKLMMNITKDFHRLPGKRFSFTFVADITHDNLNMISVADDDFAEFLNHYWTSGLNNDTLLVIMGDHGPRFSKTRNTFTGKLEERLPLLSIVLPKKLKEKRPGIEANLRKNVKVLTTPHDLYATIMDALDWRQHWNRYKIKGADLKRGLTLFEPIPSNRSCSEAGIEPHWCSCLKWDELPNSDPLYEKAANSFVDYLNQLTEAVRPQCVPRTLTSIDYVHKQKANEKLLAFAQAKDNDGYIGNFNAKTQYITQNYQLKLTVGPGVGIYEASMKFDTASGKFQFSTRDISRISAYGNEPSCISETHPHLNKYCYCKDFKPNE